MEQRISEFGKYQGYTEKAYDDSQRSSDYLTLSDGTRVAYDLFLPTKKGSLPISHCRFCSSTRPICEYSPFSTRMGRALLLS